MPLPSANRTASSSRQSPNRSACSTGLPLVVLFVSVPSRRQQLDLPASAAGSHFEIVGTPEAFASE